MSITFIPYSFGLGAQKLGSELGPVYLRHIALEHSLGRSGLDVDWMTDRLKAQPHENPPKLGSMARLKRVVDECDSLSKSVYDCVKAGRMPVTIGGDHSLAIGSVSGFVKAKNSAMKTGLLWLDAHLDAHDPKTTPSHAVHGMPAAILMGQGHPLLTAIGGKDPKIDPKHVCYLGVRSYESGEQHYLEKLGVKIFYMKDIQDIGWKAAFDQALDIITTGTEQRYLSFDLDFFDPKAALSVGSPADGGPMPSEVMSLIANVARQAEFGGMDLAEFNPLIKGAQETAWLVEDIMKAILIDPNKNTV